MDDDLRIPLTISQKQQIRDAAEAIGIDMTVWARPILLEAAKQAVK